jgi:hypothetical protein
MQRRSLLDRHRLPVSLDPSAWLEAAPADSESAPTDVESPNGHLVLGERASLVRNDDRAGTESLHGGQPAHDRVPPGHAPDTHGQRDGHHDRETLGNRRNGDGDGGEKHLSHRLAAREARGEGHRAESDDGPGHPLPEPGHAVLERRFDALGLVDLLRDLAHPGACAGGHHEATPPAAGDRRSGERHVPALGDRQRALMGDRLGDLPDGHGFAREHRLVALEPGGLDEAQVGRHDVARLEEDDVAWDDLCTLELGSLPAAQHGRPGRDHPHERSDRILGAVLLHESDHGIQHEHEADDERVLPVRDRQ